jgi:hypothetical protein
VEDEVMAGDDQPERHLQIEYMGRSRGGAWGTKVNADGRAEEWTDQEGWQPLVQLDAAAIESLREAVTESSFFALPEKVGFERAVRDGTTLRWEVEMDGERHAVDVRHNPVAPNPALALLDQELQRVVGEALNREADEE